MLPALVLIVTVLTPVIVMAQPARPDQAQQELQRLEQDLKSGEARKEALDTQAEQLEKELAGLRARAIAAAEESRLQEAELAAIETRLAGLSGSEKQRVERIEQDRAALTELLGALQRLSRLPPDALIARPEAPGDTVKSALLLRAAIPELKARADRLSRELSELASLRTELAAQRRKASAAVAMLDRREAETRSLVSRREELSRKTDAERRQLAERLNQLAGKAGDLKDLIDRLEVERKQAEERERAAAVARRALAEAERERRASEQVASLKRAPLPPKSGGLLMPVGGEIETKYGQVDRFGTTSRGLTLKGRPGSSVVAPGQATVIFAGPFKGYGQILILEHSNGYHSLLAGLGRIDATVGQRVLTGEPVGALTDGTGPTLYFELRRAGQPVNPLRGLSGSDGKGQG
jgi:murein hydrolase activator